MASGEPPLEFDVDEIDRKTKEFEDRFAALTMLDPGNKVGVDSRGNLYAEFFRQPQMMAIIRRLTGQRREDINNYMLTNFGDYEQFLLFVANARESMGDLDRFQGIIMRHKMLCLGMVSGLTNLKTSYPDYQPIIETCDKFIDKFNIFRGRSHLLLSGARTEGTGDQGTAAAANPGDMNAESR